MQALSERVRAYPIFLGVRVRCPPSKRTNYELHFAVSVCLSVCHVHSAECHKRLYTVSPRDQTFALPGQLPPQTPAPPEKTVADICPFVRVGVELHSYC